MARSTYFDLGRSADACPGSESGYAQRFQCGNIVKRRIWTRMGLNTLVECPGVASTWMICALSARWRFTNNDRTPTDRTIRRWILNLSAGNSKLRLLHRAD